MEIRLTQTDGGWALAEGGIETHGLSRTEVVGRIVGLVGASGPMHPSPATLTKIGSLARHAEEIVATLTEIGSLTRHGEDARESGRRPLEVDLVAAGGLLSDPEVQEWMAAMDALALLPVMR